MPSLDLPNSWSRLHVIHPVELRLQGFRFHTVTADPFPLRHILPILKTSLVALCVAYVWISEVGTVDRYPRRHSVVKWVT